MIDVGQSVNTIHDKWRDFLARDVHNILHYFHHKREIQDVDEVEARTLEYVLDLLTALEEQEILSDASALDCSASASMTLEWGIYTLKLPRGGDYGRMLRLLQKALESEKMPQNEPGIFDFTVKDGEVIFKRKS